MPEPAKSLQKIVEAELRTKIMSGEWPPNTMITSENELANQYSISRMTARTAITHLVGAGLLYRIPGKGTFVSAPKTVARTSSNYCVRQQLESQGITVQTNILTKDEIPATKLVAQELNISPGALVYYIKRLRIVDGEPFYYEHAYFSKKMCPNFLQSEFETNATCNILEKRYSIVSCRIRETLESTVASFADSELLRVVPGHPLLLLGETYYTNNAIPYEFSQMLFRGDKIRLSFDYFPESKTF